MKIICTIIERFNLTAATSLLSFALVISGIVMTIQGIKEQGVIDIKSTILSGRLETGSAGLSLVFLGAIVAIVNVVKSNRPHKINFKKDGLEISWHGQFRSAQRMGEILRELLVDVGVPEQRANKTNAAEARNSHE